MPEQGQLQNRQPYRPAQAPAPRPGTNDLMVALAKEFGFRMELGELILMEGKVYATAPALRRLAHSQGACEITSEPVLEFCDIAAKSWVFKARVVTKSGCVATGWGDANPSNVTSKMLGSIMRMAETRAVNRAIRNAYSIGVCSVEELPNGEETSTSTHTIEAQGHTVTEKPEAEKPEHPSPESPPEKMRSKRVAVDI